MDDMNSLCKLLLLGYFVCLEPDIVASKHVSCYKGAKTWCQNMATAVECNAVDYCIQNVWEKRTLNNAEVQELPAGETFKILVQIARMMLQAEPSKVTDGVILDDLCMRDEFPTSFQDKCVKVVAAFKSYMTDVLISDFTSAEENTFSSYADGNIETNEINELGGSNGCALCEISMQKLKEIIEDKKTKEEIKNVLNEVCNYMPSISLVYQCKRFVDKNADIIMKFIQETSPKVMCAELSPCRMVEHQSIKTNQMNDLGGLWISLECDICKFTLNEMKYEIYNVKTQKQIKDFFRSLCYIVPHSHPTYIRQCEEHIEIAAQSIIKQLITANVDHVCKYWFLC